MKDAPPHIKGFILLSEATTRLVRGMWGGGLRQAEPVRTVKEVAKIASVGFAPWREHAGKRLTVAVRQGELAAYLGLDHRRSSEHLVAPQRLPTTPVPLPTNVLNRMITSHGSLQDDPIRPSMTTAESDPKLFQLLTVGVLLVRTTEFEAWYQSERNKGKWPSQRLKSKLKIGRGRPTKQTEAARNSVIGLVRDGKWCGKMGVTELRRLLIDSGRDGIPSTDTLRRMVDQLHRETGVPALFRKAPARRKRLKNAGLK